MRVVAPPLTAGDRRAACTPDARSLFYRRALLPWGSATIASIALIGLVQRALFPADPARESAGKRRP
jgi:hypothetical protein